MTQFKVGDRVRLVGRDWGTSYEDEGIGVGDIVTIDEIDHVGSIWAGVVGTVGSNGALYSDDNPELTGDYRVELAEDQPNRTYYEPLSEVVSGFADTPLPEDEIKQVRTLGEQLGVQTFESNVHRILNGVADTVVQKNISYGDSALNPIRVFSKADRMEQLFVRLDDKLSRVQRGSEYPGDDTLRDIIGYCTLVLIARETE